MKIASSVLFLFAYFGLSAQVTGKWYASMSVMGTSERIAIHAQESPIKVDFYFTDRDSIKPLKTDNVILSDSSLAFTWKAGALTYRGSYFPAGDTLSGKMSQSGIEWNVTFHRKLQEKIIVHRPQEPKPPFTYKTKDVLIQNGDVLLGATITYPDLQDTAVFPIVILASGSGAQDRNCELMSHKPFWVIADHLANNGIATLRFDDRGVGKSTGSFQQATLEDFASDVLACVDFLTKDPYFKKRAIIGVAGHSEGGMHVLMAAKKSKKIKFVIQLASVGTSGREVLIEQQYLIPLKSGKSNDYASWNRDVFKGMCDIVSANPESKTADILGVFLDSMYTIAPTEYKEQTNIFNFKIGMTMFMNNEWMRQFIAFEAADYLKKINVPILAINGGEDIQVPAESAQEVFDYNLSKKSRGKSKLIWKEGLNHLFQKCSTCTIAEYGELEETISLTVLNGMTEWIKSL